MLLHPHCPTSTRWMRSCRTHCCNRIASPLPVAMTRHDTSLPETISDRKVSSSQATTNVFQVVRISTPKLNHGFAQVLTSTYRGQQPTSLAVLATVPVVTA